MLHPRSRPEVVPSFRAIRKYRLLGEVFEIGLRLEKNENRHKKRWIGTSSACDEGWANEEHRVLLPVGRHVHHTFFCTACLNVSPREYSKYRRGLFLVSA